MHAIPLSRHSPVYHQAGPSSALTDSSRIFHPPPSAPPFLPSPTFACTPQRKTSHQQTLSDCCPTRTAPLAPSASIPPPPMNKVAEFAAQMICYLWFAEPSSLARSSSSIDTLPSQSAPISTAQLVPNPEFILFIHNVLNTTQLSHSVVLLALFYIHRLKTLNPIKPNAKSEYRIGVVSLMLANKMLDDHTYTAKTWADVSRLPLASLNDGEIEFLQGLSFQLHVNVRDFSAWFRLLHGMVHLKDRHTANALASGPRTRWFKKMRVISGEGLDVLEGLVSPIRNSTSMREEEDKAHLKLFPPTPTRPAPNPVPRSRPTCEPPVAQPTHPYNLRRSARNVPQIFTSSNRPIHSLRQTTISPSVSSSPAHYGPPSWGPSPLVPANYSRPILPLLNLTPVQVSKPQSQPTRQPCSYEAYHSSTRSDAPLPSAASHKRSLSDTIEEPPSATQERKRIASMVDTSFDPQPTPVSRKPPALAQSRLPPIALPNSSPPNPNPSGLHYYLHPQSSTHPNYLAHPIVPSQPGSIPDLYFHSLGACGPAQLVRQEVNCQGSQVYVFGSQPWRQGTPMASSTQSSPQHLQYTSSTPSSSSMFYHPEISPYSNFSNAGLPSVANLQTALPSHHLHPHQQRVISRVRSAVEEPWTTTSRPFKYGILGR